MTGLFALITDEHAEVIVGGNGNAGNVIPAFVANAHGVGSDHQAGNDPGDVAGQRHNFANPQNNPSGKNAPSWDNAAGV
jgi:hypothetical protein